MNSSQKVLPYKGYMLISDLGPVPETYQSVLARPDTDNRDALTIGRVERDNSLLQLNPGSRIIYRGLSGTKLNEAQRLLRWEEVVALVEDSDG